MTTPNNNTPDSFEGLLASVPDSMRGQPLTVCQFLSYVALLVKANKELQRRVAQLEQQASAKGGGHG